MSSTTTQANSTAASQGNPASTKKGGARSKSKSKSKTGKSNKSSSKRAGSSSRKSGHGSSGRSKSKDRSSRSKSKGGNNKHGSSSSSSRHASKSKDKASRTASVKKVVKKEKSTSRAAPVTTILTPVVTPSEPIKMTFIEDKTKSNGVKTEMRRAPYRSLLKHNIRETQKKHHSLSGKEVRMNRDVPKVCQAETENWTKDQLKIMALFARHASRNTISPEDVKLIAAIDSYYGGSTTLLNKLKTESSVRANRRNDDRKQKKIETDKANAAAGIPPKPKSVRVKKAAAAAADAMTDVAKTQAPADVPPLSA